MTINRLIALGGRGVKSPAERFIETKGQMERGRLRQVQEQGAYQNIGLKGQQAQQQEQERQMIMMGRLAKGVLDSENKPEAYRQARSQLSSFGVDTTKIPPEYDPKYDAGLMQMVEMAGMELDEKWTQGVSPSGAPVQQARSGKQIPGVAPDVTDTSPPIKRTMPSGVNEKGQNMVVDRLYSGNQVIEESEPYVKKEITREATVEAADYGGIGKTGRNEIDKKAIGALGLRDSLTSLGSMMDENKDEYTLLAGLNAWAGNTVEYLGADIGPKWRDEITTRQTLDGKTRSAETMIRIATTGMAASAKELDEHIRPRVKEKGDAYTKARAKLDALIEFEELTTVRMNQLRNQGFEFRTVGEGDNAQLIATKGGVSKPIQQVAPLTAISPYNDRKNEVLLEKLQGRNPKTIPKKELFALMSESLDVLEQEGYNVKARRK